ncbi:MAG: rRNA pseudouridine synthase [Oligoflexia bacterium]|nr:rRNA pseudouridine synthase [Oligoflexia bacterium]
MLDASRLDKKATHRARRFKEAGIQLPALREEETKDLATKKKNEERLQKVIATAGVASRRKAEELILLGLVTVNGKVETTLGTKVNPLQDIISVEGKVIDTLPSEKEYYVLNKPRGYITSTIDPQGRPTVMDLMKAVKTRVYPVGRLDYASEGLLLFTNDGDFAHRVMHPSTQVRRTYLVKIKGYVSEKQIRELKEGVNLSDGFVKPLKVRKHEKLENKEWIEIEITEGKNLEIRRIFAVLDLEVERLRRISIGKLKVHAIPVGKFIKLAKTDIDAIFE